MVTASFINRLSQAVDRIESQRQPRPWKVVQIRRDIGEDEDVALVRHYAVYPEDRDADVVIWKFFDDKRTVDEGSPPSGSLRPWDLWTIGRRNFYVQLGADQAKLSSGLESGPPEDLSIPPGGPVRPLLITRSRGRPGSTARCPRGFY